jgi:hypothetical protein
VAEESVAERKRQRLGDIRKNNMAASTNVGGLLG